MSDGWGNLPQETQWEVDEEQFWAAEKWLTYLHDFARARRASPWALLGVTLARVVTTAPPRVVLPPIVGARYSLNLFVAVVGPSGAGKGAAEAAALEAVALPYVETHNVGSGEGIAHGFMHRQGSVLTWNDDSHAVLFSVPEIDSMTAQGSRSGATLLSQLRSAWSGEQLGFGYADPKKRILIPRHEYRLCLVAGVQPSRAGALLDDTDAGTPQRFLWMPATDPGMPDSPPPEPPTWTHVDPDPPDDGWHYIDVCDYARTVIDTERVKRARGDHEAIDGHALMNRLKVATALGMLDARWSVSMDDWDLAGVIMAKSDETRAGVQETLRAARSAETTARGEAEATRAIIIDERKDDARVQRVSRNVARRLRADGGWVTRTVIRDRVAKRDRDVFDDALDRLIDAGQVAVDDTGRASTYKAVD